MKTEGIRQLFYKNGRMRGLAIVILAAILLETIAAIQYYYTRSVLEHYLEKQVLIMLRASCMRMDGNLNAIVSQASNEIWHAQQHLDDPAYIEQMVTQLVKDGNGTVKGAAVAFRANYYKQKGKWYEPYAIWKDGTVSVEQIGSAAHDYFNMSFYKSCVNGETPHWSPPYIFVPGTGDDDGSRRTAHTLYRRNNGSPQCQAADVRTQAPQATDSRQQRTVAQGNG